MLQRPLPHPVHVVPTCHDFVNILLAAPADNAPTGPLRDVQQVVVGPEADQSYHWEVQHLKTLGRRNMEIAVGKEDSQMTDARSVGESRKAGC
jgi:hypothetical protein